jgi:hypothetical protein
LPSAHHKAASSAVSWPAHHTRNWRIYLKLRGSIVSASTSSKAHARTSRVKTAASKARQVGHDGFIIPPTRGCQPRRHRGDPQSPRASLGEGPWWRCGCGYLPQVGRGSRANQGDAGGTGGVLLHPIPPPCTCAICPPQASRLLATACEPPRTERIDTLFIQKLDSVVCELVFNTGSSTHVQSDCFACYMIQRTQLHLSLSPFVMADIPSGWARQPAQQASFTCV